MSDNVWSNCFSALRISQEATPVTRWAIRRSSPPGFARASWSLALMRFSIAFLSDWAWLAITADLLAPGARYDASTAKGLTLCRPREIQDSSRRRRLRERV